MLAAQKDTQGGCSLKRRPHKQSPVLRSFAACQLRARQFGLAKNPAAREAKRARYVQGAMHEQSMGRSENPLHEVELGRMTVLEIDKFSM